MLKKQFSPCDFKILSWCPQTGELPLFLSSYTRHYECMILSKYYIKFQRPKVCILSSTSTPIRLLQKKLSRWTDWIVIIHPRVILPDDFWDIIESECTDPEIMYGADPLIYDTVEQPYEDPYESENLSCNGYLQIYHNGRYPPFNKIYSEKSNADTLFRDLWTKRRKLPLNIKYIM
jgi:hypothetical protein